MIHESDVLVVLFFSSCVNYILVVHSSTKTLFSSTDNHTTTRHGTSINNYKSTFTHSILFRNVFYVFAVPQQRRRQRPRQVAAVTDDADQDATVTDDADQIQSVTVTDDADQNAIQVLKIYLNHTALIII